MERVSVKNGGREGARAKRPYERPRIVYSEEIEALAGVCDTAGGGKQPGNVTCSIFRS